MAERQGGMSRKRKPREELGRGAEGRRTAGRDTRREEGCWKEEKDECKNDLRLKKNGEGR